MFPGQQPMFRDPGTKPDQLDLRHQIACLINELDNHSCEPVSVLPLTARFAIKARRLYDFINILSAIGCCRKSGLGHLIWVGRHQIPAFLANLGASMGIDNPEKTLCELFPISECVGMANLTVRFMLMFRALRTNQVDLRFVGNLFARKTNRYKSTLCKLYQISFVLCAVGVCARTSQVCQVVLSPAYVNFPLVEPERAVEADPREIDSLLNRRSGNEAIDCALRRRKEINGIFLGSAVSKTVTLPDEDAFSA
jgi:hypothetical protein